ncbi:MAG: DUF4236 domain-containing protein [Cyanobium sp.]|jgi:hypothetical protein
MGFRFRRSSRLGPVRLNFSKNGLSSISLGGRGASLNIPVNRRGGTRTTVGLPGTGLSWSWEQEGPARQPAGPAEGLPNSRRLRPGQLEAFKQSVLALLSEQLFGSGCLGEALWQQGLVGRLLGDGRLGARLREQLGVIASPQALESYLLAAQSQDDTKRRAQRAVEAVRQASTLARERGWQPAEGLEPAAQAPAGG